MKFEELIYKTGNHKKPLNSFDTAYKGDYKDKKDAAEDLEQGVKDLAELQEKLYAFDKYSLLIIFQAMDAAGKDGTIKHVMSGVNPQGCQVKSFKTPSVEELDHDYLWRCSKALPEKGNIGIFNRSYYEEVLVVKVHQAYLAGQKLPDMEKKLKNGSFWKERYTQINNFEKHLAQNGTHVLKFFLNVSKEEQKNRFLDRLNDPSKNWKFSLADCKERGFWNDYMKAYEEMLGHTSTSYAPWHVIPADHKWFMRAAVCGIIVDKLKSFDLKFPGINPALKKELDTARTMLEKE
jgi:PPK2 family polyphosphate:nucleotide phosphotransferase